MAPLPLPRLHVRGGIRINDTICIVKYFFYENYASFHLPEIRVVFLPASGYLFFRRKNK